MDATARLRTLVLWSCSALFALMLLLAFFSMPATARPELERASKFDAAPQPASAPPIRAAQPFSATDLYLPVMVLGQEAAQAGGEFDPQSDTSLPAGIHEFDSFTIRSGINVTAQGPVTIRVSGPIRIAGNLLADCVRVELNGQAEVEITGVIDNRCMTGSNAEAGDLLIYSAGHSLLLGALDDPAIVETDGELDVANAPELADWEFDVLPAQRAAQALAPVCSASVTDVWLTGLPDAPASVRFYAAGADPDGGPLSYAWDFGDGSPPSQAVSPQHTFTVTGIFSPTLTVTDDEDERCVATLRLVIDDGDESVPAEPGLYVEPGELVVAVGEETPLDILALDAEGDRLDLRIDMGDGTQLITDTQAYSYTAPGRYPISVTASDADGHISRATASIYVYADPQVGAARRQTPAVNCTTPPAGSLVVNAADVGAPAAAAAGKDGRRRRFRGRGNIVIGGGVNLRGQDGGDGADKVGVGSVLGGHGGDGGDLLIGVAGDITFCAGATVAAGNGGDGGDATATAPAPGHAKAFGGRGGKAGGKLQVRATGSIDFDGATTIEPGDGGDGGDATATGGNGQDNCAVAEAGANASAVAGRGGHASKRATVRGNITGAGNGTVSGALGGQGGEAMATGGKGGNAICVDRATSGQGGRAYARGGAGGNALLSGSLGGLSIAFAAFVGGDGGEATAIAGAAGAATATPSGACVSTRATGRDGGKAQAVGGKGGRAHRGLSGFSADGTATGGRGGDATATGGDCAACADGGSATANAGDGGLARAIHGSPGGAGNQSQADGGRGGDAKANGGKGGACDICPAGKGGDGGSATTTGGDGGAALRGNTRNGGDGGKADATGGNGGRGAPCCGPPHQEGGAGGAGAKATSNAGRGGAPNGAAGANANKGGDGANGGDGNPPGGGGALGAGAGFPIKIADGMEGLGGNACPAAPAKALLIPNPSNTVPNMPIKVDIQLQDGGGTSYLHPGYSVFVLVVEGWWVQLVPAEALGDGLYRAQIPIQVAGAYTVAPIVVQSADGRPIPVASTPVEVTSENGAMPIDSLEVQLPPSSIAATSSRLHLLQRDEFSNVVHALDPEQIVCTSDNEAVAPGALEAQDTPFGVQWSLPLMPNAYGIANITCTHTLSASQVQQEVAATPWLVHLLDGEGRVARRLLPGDLFTVEIGVRLEQSNGSGWESLQGAVEFPLGTTILFQGCNAADVALDVECQPNPLPSGQLAVQFAASAEAPVQIAESAALELQFQVPDLALPGSVEIPFLLADFALFAPGESALFQMDQWPAPELYRSWSLSIVPPQPWPFELFVYDGGLDSAQIQDGFSGVQQLFAANYRSGACQVAPEIDVTPIFPPEDFGAIDLGGDGLDIAGAYPAQITAPAEEVNADLARLVAALDGQLGPANIVIVPEIQGGVSTVSFLLAEGEVLTAVSAAEGLPLQRAVLRTVDMVRNGAVDILPAWDDTENLLGAHDPGNLLNHASPGPWLTPTQCELLQDE